MNVYFCDVCGVRVTDLDLHSGHGMRRRNDVICAACLELGHGKGWVANHAQKQQLAFAGAAAAVGIAPVPPVHAEPSATEESAADEAQPPLAEIDRHEAPEAATPLPAPEPPELELEDLPPPRREPSPPALDMARDRLRTLDDDQPPSRVEPVRLEPEDGLELPAPTTLGEPTADDTAKVAVLHQELSTAAAGFAALTPPSQNRPAAQADDLEEVPAVGLEDSGAQAELDGAPAGDGPNAEKAETASNQPITEVPTPASRAAARNQGSSRTARGRTGSSSSANKPGSSASTPSSAPSSSSTSSRSSKVSKSTKSSKSAKSRSGRRAKPGLSPFVLLSAMSIAGILIIGSIAIYQKAMAPKPVQQTIEVKLGEEIQGKIKEASAAASSALEQKTMPALEDAKSKIHEIQGLVAQFETAAKSGSTGKAWSDDDVDRQMETWGVPDLISYLKNINEAEDILRQNETH